MKTTAREWLSSWASITWANDKTSLARDILASDAKKDATIRDLRKKLKKAQQMYGEMERIHMNYLRRLPERKP